MADIANPASFRVAIVGAGPAGLCLANLLHRADIDFTIFESRSEADHLAQQGGSVDLYPSRGLAALEAAGLLDAILKVARTNTRFKICDSRLVAWLAIPPSGKPEIDRVEMVRVMMDALPSGRMRWSKRVSHLDDEHNLHFEDGQVQRGWSLVVGADGAWSKVRRHLTDLEPVFTGVIGQTLKIPHASNVDVPLLRSMSKGSGSIFAFSEGQAFIVHIMRDDCASLTLFQVSGKSAGRDPSKGDGPKAILELLRGNYALWDPKLRQLFDYVDLDSVRSWPLHMLPAEFRWKHQQGVTLIGDAAHLMPPFGGYGVNLALFDAWNLSKAIETASLAIPEHRRDMLDDPLRAFEDEMMATACTFQKVSAKIMEHNMLTKGAPRSTIEASIMLRAHYELQPRLKWRWTILRPLLACAVYGFYAVFKMFH